jgi:hypothetical protein
MHDPFAPLIAVALRRIPFNAFSVVDRPVEDTIGDCRGLRRSPGSY